MFRSIVLIFCLLLYRCIPVSSQIPTDSLKSLLSELSGKERVDLLNQLAYDLKFNEQDASTGYAREAWELSRSLAYAEGEVKAILNIGIVHDIQGRSDSSEWYFTKAYEFARTAGLAYYEANAVNNLGMMNWNRGNFQEAINYFFQALKLYEQLENQGGISKATSNIGLIYQELNQWDKALEMNLQAFQLRKAEGNPDLMARSCNNIGICYKSLGEYDKAITYYQSGIEYAKTANSNGVLAGIYTNLAVLAQIQNKISNALDYQLKSLSLREGKDMFGMLADNNNLAGIYFELGEYRKGIDCGLRALSISRSMNNTGHTDESYYNLGLNYMHLNAKDSARYYFERAFAVRDSIYSERHALELATLEADYEKEKKEVEIEQLTSAAQIKDLKLKQSRSLFIISVLVTLFILLIAGFVYTRIRLKQRAVMSEERRKQQQLRYRAVLGAEEQERKRIAGELHDGLGQLLSTTKLNLSSLENRVKPDQQKALTNSMHLIDNAVEEVRGISHNLMPNTLVSFGLIPALNEQINLINDSGKLHIQTDFPEESISIDETRSIALFRAMQELLNNSIKYSGTDTIWVKIEQNGNAWEFTVKDDGKGFDTGEIESSSGIGWKNIMSRVELINAVLEVDSVPGKGTTTKIILPF